jgi:hypothetical protein
MPSAPRDRAAPALAVLLAVLAVPAVGGPALPGLPSTPAAYQALALVVTALALLAFGPVRRGRPLVRCLALLLTAVPFLLFGVLEGGGAQPSPGWWGLAASVALLALLRAPRAATGAVASLLAAGVVLGAAGWPLLPAGWNACADPQVRGLPDPATPAPGVRGLRVGAAVPVERGRAPALGSGRGPWWVEATRATRPGRRPLVLVLGSPARGPSWIVGDATLVSEADLPFTHAQDLRCCDVVIALEDAWGQDDPRGRAKARAVEGFLRKGGLVIGPAPGHAWPPGLGPRLRAAGRSPLAGTAGVRRLGLGRVARAAHQQDVADLLGADLWVREVGSSLLDPGARPPSPAGWAGWRDRPAGRRTQGVLLGVFALALVALGRLLGGGRRFLAATLLAAGLVAAGLAWTSPLDPGFEARGAVLDLGGAGGRRVEAVWISAGPTGYEGHVQWRGGGIVGLRGGTLTASGAVRVAPGHSAWVVREAEGRGAPPGDPADPGAAALRPLLTGDVDPARLRPGRAGALPVRVEGWGPVSAASLVYAAPKS